MRESKEKTEQNRRNDLDRLCNAIGNGATWIGEISDRTASEAAVKAAAANDQPDPRMSTERIQQMLSYIRENGEKEGWTVPFVKRGPAVEGELRYRVVLLDAGETLMEEDGAELIMAGAAGTNKVIGSLADKGTRTLRMAAASFKSVDAIRILMDHADVMELQARYSQRILDDAQRVEELFIAQQREQDAALVTNE